MKFAVVLAVSLAISQAADVKVSSGSTKKETNDGKIEKRTLVEGNAGVQKRAPAISDSTLPTGPKSNIEYADEKETHQDKSPTQIFGLRIRSTTPQASHNCDDIETSTGSGQQIYATPGPPQVAKISDVVTQGHPFPAAIASHLYSPVSVYQARLGSPTTYEISAPVASQLAYSEHKIYQPSPQNTIQYYNSQPKIQEPQGKTAFARLTVPYQQFQQSVFGPPQGIIYTQQQNQIPQSPPSSAFFQYIPQVPFNSQHAQIQYQPQPAQIQYAQPQITYAHNQVQQQLSYPQNTQIAYGQNQYQQPQVYQDYQNQQAQVFQLIPQPQPQPEQPLPGQQNSLPQKQQELQPNALFVRIQQENSNLEPQRHPPTQRELKQVQVPQGKILNKPSLVEQQIVNDKPQGGAVSYASFSQGPPSPNYITNNYQQSYQHRNTLNAPGKLSPQQQIQQQHYEQQQRDQQLQYQQQYQQQNPQVQQYQQQPNYQLQQQQIVYVKPEQLAQNIQNYLPQTQIYQQNTNSQSDEDITNAAYIQTQPIAVAPTFPPVQYYGKFAQNVFGSYHQQ